jgi:hypothetical protein
MNLPNLSLTFLKSYLNLPQVTEHTTLIAIVEMCRDIHERGHIKVEKITHKNKQTPPQLVLCPIHSATNTFLDNHKTIVTEGNDGN